jgi:Zn-dependent protease with chaperone function
MDFFARQEAARRTTRWLVLGFLLSVLAIVTVIYCVAAVAMRATDPDIPAQHMAASAAFIVAIVIIGATLVKVAMLRSGGSAVARSLGGVRIDRNTSDPSIRRLHNVVEEIAIASGVTMPEVYVLEDEDGINAFAAGNSPADAAIAVTRGALRRLNREELQGVIGHEFSHVLNGDMRLNVKLIGLTFGLLCIAIIGRTLFRFGPRGGSRDRNNGAAVVMVIALAMLVLGYLGVFFGQLMQAAVSRHRERLADASSVQFTRNPGGLKNALLKIAANASGAQLATARVDEVAHMLFAPGIKRLFATHPSIPERLAELDPTFKPAELPELVAEAARQSERLIASAAAVNEEWKDEARREAPDSPRRAPDARQFVENVAQLSLATHVGELEPQNVRFAAGLRLALPPELHQFADSPDLARALIIALLVSDDEAVLALQRVIIERAYGAAFFEEVTRHLATARALPPLLRLPAVQQVFPTLRRLTPVERQQLAQVVSELSSADAHVDVFECCLSLLLASSLEDNLSNEAPHGNRTLGNSAPALQTLFAILAAQGAVSEDEAIRAYEAGMAVVLPGPGRAFRAIDRWQAPLRAALVDLKWLQPTAKRALVEGLVRTIAHDNRLSTEEAEILRTVCAMLHCPLPPLLSIAEGARAGS